jgi:hypothetical protein
MRRAAGRRQQRDHFRVAQLMEILVVTADCAQSFGRRDAHRRIGLILQRRQRVGGGDRRRQHQPARAAPAHRAQGDAHRRAGRDAVIDNDRGLAGDLDRRPAGAIELPPALQLGGLPGGFACDVGLGNRQRLHHAAVDEHLRGAAVGHRAQGQFRLPRHADLAHQYDAERRRQRLGRRCADRHPAAGQRQHDGILFPQMREQRRKTLARLLAVAKHCPILGRR